MIQKIKYAYDIHVLYYDVFEKFNTHSNGVIF